MERVDIGDDVGGGWVEEDRRPLLGPTRCQAVEDELAAGVYDELKVGEVDYLACN